MACHWHKNPLDAIPFQVFAWRLMRIPWPFRSRWIHRCAKSLPVIHVSSNVAIKNPVSKLWDMYDVVVDISSFHCCFTVVEFDTWSTFSDGSTATVVFRPLQLIALLNPQSPLPHFCPPLPTMQGSNYHYKPQAFQITVECAWRQTSNILGSEIGCGHASINIITL